MSTMFSQFALRNVTFKNRIAVSPMSQYRAVDGHANHWHLVHLGRFAIGGAGLVYLEATAVEKDGRRTHGDLGLWDDAQVATLSPIAAFIEAEGSVPGIQLGHAGRKASERRPWHGETPVDTDDEVNRGEAPWPIEGPSAVPYADGWPTPAEMSQDAIYRVITSFGEAARRACDAGFKVIEVYAAHGFLVHQFLSPISNQRTDIWGGSFANRNRFAVEVAKSVRANWPDDLPLAFRLSGTDWLDGGIELEDTIETARLLRDAGVDMIDCSSGGIGGKNRPRRMKVEEGFQVPFAEAIKNSADISTMAVGFLWDAEKCERILATKQADMIALGREVLHDPNWPLKAAHALGLDDQHALWPVEAGWWLQKRARLLSKLKIR
ncbi:NADH:flavin oxidoreductase / NADH oxidase [Alphaproteobacteria bacterium AO1-B]|nr:NADH:flavin oxidoreductase / NADH oxidase [Alphaproteobacteria bacterium AO1-B]